ncbi:hypothetical protein C6A86_018190 [Mycobacterium sp. ITM-2016-00316]|uniref:hypothetical protein n=1 Tax=Mycobacterium sp. ITM-2016-00316 TaxID=2099695 RepID=UPI001E416F8E|nr:hypothetical protein [Mycobacterium sp. ITM-2016-00316]WNG80176.1 hypothetical protein C6A86_018190 [Mycobacterium sp. ITM-2016-00316]
MRESFDDRLTRIGTEAEDGEADQSDRPLPDNVSVSRPGRGRSKVLQVRLSPDEFEALEGIAAGRDLPVSTIAREHLLSLIRTQPERDEHRGVFVSYSTSGPASVEDAAKFLAATLQRMGSMQQEMSQMLTLVATCTSKIDGGFAEFSQSRGEKTTEVPAERP